MSAGACTAGAGPHLAVSRAAGLPQQTVPVSLLYILSCTYDNSGAYIKLCEPMIDNKGDNEYWFVKMSKK